MNWQVELITICKNGGTDSDIEDYIYEHPDINARDIWNFVYEYYAPNECKGCLHIQMSGLFPCNSCSRRVHVRDFYECKENKL